MKIKAVKISGLFGKSESVEYYFNDDLNILTGRNGSGKTTVLKLMWFIISGNIIHALREINFRSCHIITDEYSCNVIKTGPINCKIEFEKGGRKQIFEDEIDDTTYDSLIDSAEDKAGSVITNIGSSIFFPTFRRIEGGFTMLSGGTLRQRPGARSEFDIDSALSNLSVRLTNNEHIFVSAISTKDVVSLLLKRYASFSEEINTFQEEISRGVIEKIKNYQRSQSSRDEADSILSETRDDIEKIEEFRKETMKPLDAVRVLVERLFQHSGIAFGKRLNFGDAAEAVSSDFLSAGEKQMLSFICYNAFYKNSVIFIDEPELSLHVDWQRQLYPILKSQDTGNQFIFATHSPFIYGKYPDKEVFIGNDRGDGE